MSRIYYGSAQDNDLYSGYFTAVAQFARDMLSENVHEIRLESHTILFDLRESLLLVVVVFEKTLDKAFLTAILNQIYFAFLTDYHEYLVHRYITPHNFAGFTTTIDQILAEYGVGHLVLVENTS